MSHEDNTSIVLQVEGRERLPDARQQLLVRCNTVVDYLFFRPRVLRTVELHPQRRVAFYCEQLRCAPLQFHQRCLNASGGAMSGSEISSALRRGSRIASTIRRRAIATSALFAFLFSVIAIAQYAFVRHQLYSVARTETDTAASDIAAVLSGPDGLNLQEYRQAFFPASEWFVISSDGSIIDAESSIPGLLGRVITPTNLPFGAPQTLVSEFGEEWRILGRRLDGGMIVAGIREPGAVAMPDKILSANVLKFQSRLKDAGSINPKSIDERVEYAVFDDSGILKAAWGALPLRCTLQASQLSTNREINVGGKPYIVSVCTACDSQKRSLASVIVPKEMTEEHRALKAQAHFDLYVAIAAWLTLVGIALGHFTREEIRRQHVSPSLTEARIQGEGQHIEFKRALLWSREHNVEDNDLRKGVLKTIVGFLNSGGGSLFIGIQDDGNPWGIADDLRCCGNSEDRFHLRVRDMVANLIGEEFCNFITSSLISDPKAPEHRVCAIGVSSARRAAFFDNAFYIRNGPQTVKLNMHDALVYIQNAGLKI